MSLITISDLTFAYPGSYDNIFEHVSLELDSRWRLGLIGRNGTGKTTLFRLLMGEFPYSGTIAAKAVFSYFPYTVENPEAAAGDAAAAICPQSDPWQLSRELNLLQVPEDVLERPYSTLSSGEQVKLLLAALFLREDSFLLIDEPTNHLDQAARSVIADYLRRKSGFILVSHDRTLLDRCTDHILSLNRADITLQKGNFSVWQAGKEARDQAELARNERLKKEVRRLQDAARQAAQWSDRTERTKKGSRIAGLRPDRGAIGHKAAKMMKRSKGIEARREAALEEKAGLLKNVESAPELKLSPLAYPQSRLAELRGVSICYSGPTVCRDVTFSIDRGDRICLSGRNGSGKSSVLKLLLGQDIPHSGMVTRGSQLKISYVPQDAGFLAGPLRDFIRESGTDESLMKAVLRKLGFSRLQFEKDLSDYSAGQKKKVLLASSLCQQAHLYIWDEPLNYIDILSRIQIEDLLTAFPPTLIFVEHDPCFQQKIATQVVTLED